MLLTIAIVCGLAAGIALYTAVWDNKINRRVKNEPYERG
jgi:hypothetical protein